MQTKYFNKAMIKNAPFEERYNKNIHFLNLLQANPTDEIFKEHRLFLSHTLCKHLDTLDYVLLLQAVNFYENSLEHVSLSAQYYIDILEMLYIYQHMLSEMSGVFKLSQNLFEFCAYFDDIRKHTFAKMVNLDDLKSSLWIYVDNDYIAYWQYDDEMPRDVQNISQNSSHTQEEKEKYLATLQANLEKYSPYYTEIYCAHRAMYTMESFDLINIMQSVAAVENMIASLFEATEPYKSKFARLYYYLLNQNEKITQIFAINFDVNFLEFDNPFFDCRFKNKECAKLYLKNQRYDLLFEKYKSDKQFIKKTLLDELEKMYQINLISLQFYRYIFEMGITHGMGHSLQEKLEQASWLLEHTDQESEPNIFLINSLNVIKYLYKMKQTAKADKWLDSLLPMVYAIDLREVSTEMPWYEEEAKVNELKDSDIGSINEVLYIAHRYEDFEKLFLQCEELGIYENLFHCSTALLERYIEILKSQKNRGETIKVYEKKLSITQNI
jgi:hypothetical protein